MSIGGPHEVLPSHAIQILGRDFSLAEVLLALEAELAQGWRLGTPFDEGTLRTKLGMVDPPEPADDRGLPALAVVGRLRILGVVDLQHLQHPQRNSGEQTGFRRFAPSDIASLSPLGVRVIRILRAERTATK